jgi:hypothetical protein
MISVAVLRAMAAAGATTETIIAAIEADQVAEQERLKTKRRKDAARKRRSRASAKSRDVTQCPRDMADAPQPVEQAEPATPQDAVVTPVAASADNSPKKERSPTPPKEKTNTRAYARARASRLPEDWKPTPDDLTSARSLIPEARIEYETDKFRDYWHAKAGAGATKLDWSATWRNWCRRASEGQARPPPRQPPLPFPPVQLVKENPRAKTSNYPEHSWQASRDRWRAAAAKLSASVAADEADEEICGEIVQPPAAARPNGP